MNEPLTIADVVFGRTEANAPKAVRFNPHARAYEAFSLDNDARGYTKLYEPLSATTLKDALAEVTARRNWDRGDRIGVRELGAGRDFLHVYAVRRNSQGSRVWKGHVPATEYGRWLEHIATIDVDVLAGTPRGCVGFEIDLHEHRERLRPESARMVRRNG